MKQNRLSLFEIFIQNDIDRFAVISALLRRLIWEAPEFDSCPDSFDTNEWLFVGFRERRVFKFKAMANASETPVSWVLGGGVTLWVMWEDVNSF